MHVMARSTYLFGPGYGVFMLTQKCSYPPSVRQHAAFGLRHRLYSVGFDPLDGSSIIDANFAVGSIFGVWPGDKLLGRTGRQQVQQ